MMMRLAEMESDEVSVSEIALLLILPMEHLLQSWLLWVNGSAHMSAVQ